ncbi:hypothetical protein CEXT_339851 [Caerostris extrusa]|uniref:Uncharacterized protein n=1 Tax=Caerostris extrusa TaxID=172846 RepID=A0AAV4XHS2_CAEEX|nr:hypothetical protein CEXT_339851 [Caerostris extrusa]
MLSWHTSSPSKYAPAKRENTEVRAPSTLPNLSWLTPLPDITHATNDIRGETHRGTPRGHRGPFKHLIDGMGSKCDRGSNPCFLFVYKFQLSPHLKGEMSDSEVIYCTPKLHNAESLFFYMLHAKGNGKKKKNRNSTLGVEVFISGKQLEAL